VSGRPGPARVALVLKGYPRLSETFIAQEIRELERRGLAVTIVSLRHPTDPARHPVHDEIVAPVVYLPEYLWREPVRVLRAWWRVRRRPGYRAMRRLWLRDLWRDRTPNRGRRFGQACVLAAEAGEGPLRDIGHLYAHFLHTPASVARYAAVLLDLPWSVSAHARDIWTIPDWEKREKLAGPAADGACWAVTCTAYGASHLRDLARGPEAAAGTPVELVYHGLDFTRFPDNPAPPGGRDGGDPDDPVVILSVGRLVAKKGYDDLLNALARLPPGLHWRFVHIGGGEGRERMAALARRLNLEDRITWRGAQPQAEVLAALRAADLFVLASRIAGDGDRDGLPNVLMEAQSQRLACIATAISAIPELIRDGETGMLVPPGDPAALAAALAALAGDVERRHRLAAAGEDRVRSVFSMDGGIDALAQRFGLGTRQPGETGPQH